jgi:hypothetical protein
MQNCPWPLASFWHSTRRDQCDTVDKVWLHLTALTRELIVLAVVGREKPPYDKFLKKLQPSMLEKAAEYLGCRVPRVYGVAETESSDKEDASMSDSDEEMESDTDTGSDALCILDLRRRRLYK